MKTLQSLRALLAVVLLLAVPGVSLAATGPATSLWLASVLPAQAKKSAGNDDVETLMSRARQAINDGNFETADSLISRVEKAKIEFGLFHRGDTPKKLRADLTVAERKARSERPTRPSQKATPEMPSKTAVETAPVSDIPRIETKGAPSREIPTEVLSPADEVPLAIPQTGKKMAPLSMQAKPAAAPTDELLTSTNPTETVREVAPAPGTAPDARRQSDTQLLAARRALAVGDVRRAQVAVELARQAKAEYGHNEDSPDRVSTAIRNYAQAAEAAAGPNPPETARRQLADLLMDQAQQLLRCREYDESERLVRHVQQLQVRYGPFEAQPEALAEKIAAARRQDPRAARTAPPVADKPRADEQQQRRQASTQAIYDLERDTSATRVAASDDNLTEPENEGIRSSDPAQLLPAPPSHSPPSLAPVRQSRTAAQTREPDAQRFMQLGEQSLREQNVPQALEFFRQAHALRDQLDPTAAQRLQDHMLMLSAPAPAARAADRSENLLEGVSSKQQLIVKQLLNDVAEKQKAATKAREANDPKRAVAILQEARTMIENSGADSDSRAQLLRRIDRGLAELDKYIADNRADVELDDSNKQTMKEVERHRQAKVDVDEKLARLIDDYNKLMDEERYAEAEVLAKRARELAPDNAVVKQIIWQNRFVTRTQRNNGLRRDKEDSIWQTLDSVEESAVPFDDREPYVMPDAKKWEQLTKTRSQRLAENRSHRTPREMEIERKLKTPVSLQFRNRPLTEVLDQLAKLAAVNLHLDPKGLDEEGVASDTPITIDLRQDISLKSALNLILEPLHLSYVIKDEVLKITSEQLRDGEVITVTYPVADLVIPIPNFTPNGRSGLAGALSDGYAISGGVAMGGGLGTAYLASADGSPASGVMSPQVLAQMQHMMPGSMGGRSRGPEVSHAGPGGLGHGSAPDFDLLIDLITSTIKPSTWDEVGGPGSITSFQNNLSLVISQTQDVHEDIVDLLDQLRRNQDLQVTIEVRFITLNDNFFERIGVDFQANVVNDAPRNPRGPGGVGIAAGNLREIVGIDTIGGNAPAGGSPSFTPNLEIPFRQSSFNLATPQFGQPVEVAHFGFAILSDLEAFLLVNAAQGDRRSNVLQAPKVTLFNGQQASVTDQTQSPFVISVIPVVGDFAAAYQPVITVLSEGTFLSVQAVVSNDRRFVRLTVIPFFSQIGDVKEFTFNGSKTTTKNTSASEASGGAGGDSTSSSDDTTTTQEGITIQLPNFSVVSVNTTVSVPDGGTVLLGGIKRLSEGRNEFGVPILSKLPYINRLFKNVGIGRETQSLMMMVTPRIIIQEEEEERIGVQLPP